MFFALLAMSTDTTATAVEANAAEAGIRIEPSELKPPWATALVASRKNHSTVLDKNQISTSKRYPSFVASWVLI